MKPKHLYPTTPVELFAYGLGIYGGSYLEDILEKERAYYERAKDKAIADSIEKARSHETAEVRSHETAEAQQRRRQVETERQAKFDAITEKFAAKKIRARQVADELLENAQRSEENPMPIPLITDEDRAAADYAYAQQAEAENDAAAAQQAEYEAAQQAEAEYHYQQQQHHHEQR